MAAFSAGVGVTVAVVCAVAAFVAHARPDAALGWAARATGREARFDEGRLSEAEEGLLLALVHGVRWPLTALVFGWGFVAGATLAWWVG